MSRDEADRLVMEYNGKVLPGPSHRSRTTPSFSSAQKGMASQKLSLAVRLSLREAWRLLCPCASPARKRHRGRGPKPLRLCGAPPLALPAPSATSPTRARPCREGRVRGRGRECLSLLSFHLSVCVCVWLSRALRKLRAKPARRRHLRARCATRAQRATWRETRRFRAVAARERIAAAVLEDPRL